MTALAFHERVGAVEFDEPLAIGAGEPVQAINVLRHNRQKLARFLQLHDCVVNRIGLRISKCFPTFEFVIPMFDACRLRAHERVVIDWRAPLPHSLRAAEIGNSAVSRDARASKNQRVLCELELRGKVGVCHREI